MIKENTMLSRANRIRMFFKGTPASVMTAALLGMMSVVIFFASAVLSVMERGNAGLILGVMGVGAMILDVVGFSLAVNHARSKGEDVYYGMSLVAVILNGAMFIIYMIFYIFGFLISL